MAICSSFAQNQKIKTEMPLLYLLPDKWLMSKLTTILNPANRLLKGAFPDFRQFHEEVVSRPLVLLDLLVVDEAAVLQQTTSLG